MTETFWEKSMMVKPNDRDVECYPSAFDFSKQYDFRIKMCTSIEEEDFFTVHHEMGNFWLIIVLFNHGSDFQLLNKNYSHTP
jgi:hypothetical protein